MNNLTLTRKMLFGMLLVSLIPIIVISQVFLSEFETELKQSEINHLSQMANKKVLQINNYVSERLNDIEVMSKSSMTIESMKDLEKAFEHINENSLNYQQVDTRLRKNIKGFLDAGYYDYLLISLNGDVVFSILHEDDFSKNIWNGPYADNHLSILVSDVIKVLESGVSNFEYYPPSKEVAAFIATPVLEEGKLLGVLVLQIDKHKIFEVVTDNLGLGATGETVIARESKDKLIFLGPLKFDNESGSSNALTMNSTLAKPMQKALKGEEGEGFSIDYRGEEVIAVWRYLPIFRWGMVVKKDTKEAFAKVNQIQYWASFVIAAVIVLIVILAYFVSKTLVRPIKELTNATSKMADGDLSQRVNVENTDEIGQLANTFNLMAKQQQITLENLKHKAEEAERASEAKSEFLSRMSHELRTPMNAILGFGNLLVTDPDEPLSEIQQESLDEILIAGNHLLYLINDILDLSKIESGKLEVYKDIVLLDDTLKRSLSFIKIAAQQKNIDVSDFISGNNYKVIADPSRLNQVLLNLLVNAVKYNREGGSITLTADIIRNNNQPVQLRLNVIDTGLGLSENEISRLFIAFERLGGNANIEGTGIGLVICKYLMEMMNGNIGVDSKKEIGSTFWIELEMVEEDVFSGENDAHKTKNVQAPEDIKLRVPEENINTGKMHENINNTDYDLKSQFFQILYIEDNPANRTLMEQILNRRNDLKLTSVNSAKEGFQSLKKQGFDIILLDINLPDMNGYEMLEQLKSMDEYSHIPIVALSANTMPEDVQKGKEAGFVDYLTKPVDISRLLTLLDKLCYQNK